MPTSLVLKHLENLSGTMIEEYRALIAKHARGRCGIYALYSDNKVYYVGLASNLNARLKHHLDDRHKGRWDRFSMYLTKNDSHIRELEALMHRVIRPEGNRQIGKLKGSMDLRRPLLVEMQERQKQVRIELFGERVRAKRAESMGEPRTRRTRPGRTDTGYPLEGWVDRSVNLRLVFKGYEYTARLRPSGLIRFNGHTYESPSAAAEAICKQPKNGWWMWQMRTKQGEWVRLRELRATMTKGK